MATKDMKEKAEAAAAAEATRSGKKLRDYIAPRIRTLALPSIQASPPCNPVSCPPDTFGCGPNVCGPVMPPPGCGPQGCNPRS